MKEVSIFDKLSAIEEMLTKLGYATDKLTLDQALDIKNAIEKVCNREGL